VANSSVYVHAPQLASGYLMLTFRDESYGR